MDLIRRLLLDLEAAPGALDATHVVVGHSQAEVAYHLALLVKGGLAEGPQPTSYLGNSTQVPDFVLATRLSPEGHDFIDTLRDDTIWKTVREKTLKVGSTATLEIVKALGQAAVRHMVGLPPG
ncbi:DUF2513 domain-containing protein [Bacillus sp. NP157]|nr:DUF2513 domain-containing protein [Bacillus sp. NP157]